MIKQVNLSSGEISYRETNKDSEKVIVLVHGNSQNSSIFEKQFKDKNLSSFRLIAPDLPGHGNSFSLESSDKYSLLFYAKILIEFIESLKLDNYILVGQSLGGHIATETLDTLDAKGILIFGSPLLSNPPDLASAFLPNEITSYFFKKELDTNKIDSLVRESLNSPPLEQDLLFLRNIIKQSDGHVRESLAETLPQLIFKDEIKIIEETNIPVAILHPENDKFINGQYYNRLRIKNLWNNDVIRIKESGHFLNWDQPDIFNNTLNDFALDIFDKHFSNRQTIKEVSINQPTI